jgi:hypothetical protein
MKENRTLQELVGEAIGQYLRGARKGGMDAK